MANRHKGFYMDVRAGQHDDDGLWEPPTPEATALGSLNTMATACSDSPLDAGVGEELREDEGEPFRYSEFLDFYGEKEGKVRWLRAPKWAAPRRTPPHPVTIPPPKQLSPKMSPKSSPKARGGAKAGAKEKKGTKVSAEELQAMMARQQESRQSPPLKSPQSPPARGAGTLRLASMTSTRSASPPVQLPAAQGSSSERYPFPKRNSGGSSGLRAAPRKAGGGLQLSPRSPAAGVRRFESASTCSRSPAASPSQSPTHGASAQPLKNCDLRQRGKTDGNVITATPCLPSPKRMQVLDNGKARINVVVVGHVDAGKSTIMGHLLVKLGLVSQKTLHRYERDSKAKGKQSFHFAWVLDETEEERDRGVTMDVAVTYFESATKRVTLLDCPGHREFVTNMITGATQADAAVLVVNASAGEFETGFGPGGQTKEHMMLLRSVGVTQLIVAVNKMDVVAYDEGRFEEIKAELGEFLAKTGFKRGDITYVPVAGLAGVNLTTAAGDDAMPWYTGRSLLDSIDVLPAPERLVDFPLRLCVSDVMKSQTLGPVAIGGKIHTGRLQVGDKAVLLPQGEQATVKAIERLAASVDNAVAGDNVEVGLCGIDPAVLAVGQVLCRVEEPQVKISQKFEATLVNFSDRMITKSFQGVIHFQSNTVSASVTRLLSATDGKNPPKMKPKCLHKNQTGTVEITVSKPVCVELADEFRDLGRFMLRAGGETVAAGVVKAIYPLVKA